MSFNLTQLEQFRNNLLAMRDDVPAIMEELVVGEGVYAVKQAKQIAKNDNPDIVNTGNYRSSFHCGSKALALGHSSSAHDGSRPEVNGKTYRIDVYNNSDYAKHLEYGFRSHWVPGKWQGRTFVYIKGYRPVPGDSNDPGGMYVGPKDGFVRGRFVLRRALRRTKATQHARLERKFNKKVKEYIERGL
ncbi:HK97 gp10 family phage protein [Paenibacillus popilliae]|uniref:HK97 gp10 family phage protein n=1 Tax=Paenibacillus popilliae ATCC 14706 TaxID=1212764 RepID=M9LNG2_PAEPP|nr:HK97 gp10 family phage protein [Paenibacillus popilliae]GAC41901.1 hypothetical protein PPOP_1258 [Paenibacillus popilliae ATCC 14706]